MRACRAWFTVRSPKTSMVSTSASACRRSSASPAPSLCSSLIGAASSRWIRRPRMAEASVVEGVYLSTALDLEELYGEAFAAHAKVRLRHPHEIHEPEAVRFALCWRPADEAFDPYPNLGLASSIAAGVDSIVNCPSLPQKVVVTRVRDGNQGDLMAGYAAWHVVWHHRNMARYLNHQR